MHRAPQHVPVEQYKANLAELVAIIRRSGAKSIILLTPPPVNDAARLTHNAKARLKTCFSQLEHSLS